MKLKILIGAGVAVLIAVGLLFVQRRGHTVAPAPVAAGGVITTPSGLRYEILREGSGVEAVPGNMVALTYIGMLSNGTVFDSILDRTKPLAFILGKGQVIKGWDEGVTGMKVGERRKLIIPPDLAYGDKGSGSVIPPDATLTFEVELIVTK